jgi:hypothetical protein
MQSFFEVWYTGANPRGMPGGPQHTMWGSSTYLTMDYTFRKKNLQPLYEYTLLSQWLRSNLCGHIFFVLIFCFAFSNFQPYLRVVLNFWSFIPS